MINWLNPYQLIPFHPNIVILVITAQDDKHLSTLKAIWWCFSFGEPAVTVKWGEALVSVFFPSCLSVRVPLWWCWVSVVAAHLCGFLICHTCTTLPHQPHQSLCSNQDHGCLLLVLAPFHSVLLRLLLFNFVDFCLLYSAYFSSVCCNVFSVFLDRVCFSAHGVDIKAAFSPASCVAIGTWTPQR